LRYNGERDVPPRPRLEVLAREICNGKGSNIDQVAHQRETKWNAEKRRQAQEWKHHGSNEVSGSRPQCRQRASNAKGRREEWKSIRVGQQDPEWPCIAQRPRPGRGT
jgi:hypothetical protein